MSNSLILLRVFSVSLQRSCSTHQSKRTMLLLYLIFHLASLSGTSRCGIKLFSLSDTRPFSTLMELMLKMVQRFSASKPQTNSLTRPKLHTRRCVSIVCLDFRRMRLFHIDLFISLKEEKERGRLPNMLMSLSDSSGAEKVCNKVFKFDCVDSFIFSFSPEMTRN